MSQWYRLVNSSGTTVLYEQGASLVAVVEKAVLEQKNLGGAVFDYMNLAGGVFAGAKMAACSFKGANLAGCNFTGSTLTTCHFEGANCVGTNFTSADLTNSDFSGALVTEATWTTATLTGVDKDAAATDADATTGTTASATPGANVIAKANGAGKLVAGWGGAASTLATLNGSALVVENPANATATPTASKIPIANASAYLAEGWRRATPTAYDFATAVPYAVLATDEALDITTGAVSDDVDLPTAVGCAGRTISIKKVDSGVGAVAVDPNGTEHIEGLGAGNPYNLTAQYQGVTLRSDGAKWHVVTSTTTTAAHASTHHPAGADEYKPPAVDTAAATPFTVLTTHRTLLGAATAGAAQVVNLYAANAAAVGRRIAVIKTDANAQNVAVTPNGADTINGANNATLSTLTAQWDFVELECVAAGAWMLVSRRIT